MRARIAVLSASLLALGLVGPACQGSRERPEPAPVRAEPPQHPFSSERAWQDLEALTALDEIRDGAEVAKLASLTKAKVGETYNLVSREGIQMHGGIGMTDEFDIGFFIKRAAVSEQTFGDVNYHRNRYGELEGY